jgi:hypothetical protein
VFGEESERRSRRIKNSAKPEPCRSASSTGLPHKLSSVDDGFASFESQKTPPGATPKVGYHFLEHNLFKVKLDFYLNIFIFRV